MKIQIVALLLLLSASSLSSQKLVPFRQGDQFGYSDLGGQLVIQPDFTEASLFNRGYAIVIHEEKQRIIDSLGNFVTRINGAQIPDGKFDRISTVSSRYYYFNFGEYAGILDSNFNLVGRLVIADESRINRGCEDYLVFKKKAGNKIISSIIDRTGREVVPFPDENTSVDCFLLPGSTQVLITSRNLKNKTYSFFEDAGRKIPGSTYDRLHLNAYASKGLLFLRKGFQVDIYDAEYNLLYKNFDLNSFQEGPAACNALRKVIPINDLCSELYNVLDSVDCVQDSSYTALVVRDRRDKTTDPQIYRFGIDQGPDEALFFNWYYQQIPIFTVIKGDQRGIRNFRNETIVPVDLYQQVRPLYGLEHILMQQHDQYWFVSAGNGIRTHQDFYSFADRFIVQRPGNSRYAFHNQDGVPLTEFRYDTIFHLENIEAFVAREGDRHWLLDKQGNIVRTFPYDRIERLYRGSRFFYLIERNGNKGVMYHDGTELIPPLYQDIAVNKRLQSARIFWATDENGKKLLVNSQDNVMDIAPDLVSKISNARLLKEGYVIIQYADRTYEFFSPAGKRIFRLTDQGYLRVPQQEVELGILKAEDHYFNYQTGLVYKK